MWGKKQSGMFKLSTRKEHTQKSEKGRKSKKEKSKKPKTIKLLNK